MHGFVTGYISALTAELGHQPIYEEVARHGTEPATGAADLAGAWCWITSATPVARADRVAASGRDSSIRSCSGVILVWKQEEFAGSSLYPDDRLEEVRVVSPFRTAAIAMPSIAPLAPKPSPTNPTPLS